MERQEYFQQRLTRAGEYLRAADYDAARQICRALLTEFADHPQILAMLGILEGMDGHPDAALDYLQRANNLHPGQPGIVNNLALALLNTGELAAAEKHLKSCLKRHPAYTPAWYTLAVLNRRLGRIDEAIAAYERVLSLDPEQPEAWANLAKLRERLNQLQLASEAVNRSLEISPSNPIARMTAAQIDGRLGHHESAIDRLEALLSEQSLGDTNEIIARSRLGDSLDAVGRQPEAFAQYREANRLQAGSWLASQPPGDGPYSLVAVGRMRRLLEETTGAVPEAAGNGTNGPFFLTGFPRSGTTLLDRMLSAHPDVCSIEEQETLVDSHRDFVVSTNGVERLLSLTEDRRRTYLDAYRRRVSDAAGPGAPVMLDKLPLHTIFLPLISRLFPGARVIFMIRDPRDVCLSCFVQRFEINAAMAHFLDLETTAQFYAAVMELGLDSLERLPIRATSVRYEQLVANPEPILRELIDFLGLPWDPAVLAYRSRVTGSRIDTPSYRQVSQPLYSSSIGRWRRYAGELEPVQQVLAPLVSRLGYD